MLRAGPFLTLSGLAVAYPKRPTSRPRAAALASSGLSSCQHLSELCGKADAMHQKWSIRLFAHWVTVRICLCQVQIFFPSTLVHPAVRRDPSNFWRRQFGQGNAHCCKSACLRVGASGGLLRGAHEAAPPVWHGEENVWRGQSSAWLSAWTWIDSRPRSSARRNASNSSTSFGASPSG